MSMSGSDVSLSRGHGCRRRQKQQQRQPSSSVSSSTSSPAAVAVFTLANGGGVLSSAAAFASASMHASMSRSRGGLSPVSALLRFANKKRRGSGSGADDSDDDDSDFDSDSDDDDAASTNNKKCGSVGDCSYSRRRLSLPSLLARRPDALLAAAVPRPAVLFGAGAAAGALGKTITAPLDRVKLLLQTSGGFETGAIAAATKGGGTSGAAAATAAAATGVRAVGRQGLQSLARVVDALAAIGKQEGVAGYWRGNLPQILKVVPYSATQLCAYELFKKVLSTDSKEEYEDEDGSTSRKKRGGGQEKKNNEKKKKKELSVKRRLAAGAAAGMVATLATHPLDTLRLRMAVDPAAKSLPLAVKILLKSGGGNNGASALSGFAAPVRAFYRGLGASVAGIAPYMAIELCTFDTLASVSSSSSSSPVPLLPPFARGLLAAGLATVLCYPLDTSRRRVQLGVVDAAAAAAASAASAASAGASSASASSLVAASSLSKVNAAVKEGKLLATAVALAKEEGFSSLYRGFLPSCLKNLPNKGVKLSVFDGAKRALAASEAALEDERERVAVERKERRERRRRKKKKRRKSGFFSFGGLPRLGGGGGEKKAALLH